MEQINFFIFDVEYLIYECNQCGKIANQHGDYFYE